MSFSTKVALQSPLSKYPTPTPPSLSSFFLTKTLFSSCLHLLQTNQKPPKKKKEAMFSIQAQMPTVSSLFSAYASLSAIIMLLRSIFNDLFPDPLRRHLSALIAALFRLHSNHHLTLVIEEGTGVSPNHLYAAAELYLSTKISPTTDRLKVSQGPNDTSLTFRFENGELIDDTYDSIPLKWKFSSLESDKRRSSDDDSGSPASFYETRFFELSFEKRFKDRVTGSYIPYMVSKSKNIKDEKRVLKLCTLGHRFSCSNIYWDSVNLHHPSTFETLAIDPDLKSAIINDMDRFVRRREYYRRVGRAWKRGYLLYGPPGTGKSSLIAAMANHLRFDIYDLQLGNLMRDSDLRRLLLATDNRSILVIEDIDCSVEIRDRHTNGSSDNVATDGSNRNKPPQVQLTLSGLLNFLDGLWSSCGDERIIIFTTNHKEKLDAALLRPGRMDMQIHMSYLTFSSFKILASNYLNLEGIDDHPLFIEIEGLIKTVNVTPAQVAEELMKTEDDVDEALLGVVKFLKDKKAMVIENDEAVTLVGDGIMQET